MTKTSKTINPTNQPDTIRLILDPPCGGDLVQQVREHFHVVGDRKGLEVVNNLLANGWTVLHSSVVELPVKSGDNRITRKAVVFYTLGAYLRVVTDDDDVDDEPDLDWGVGIDDDDSQDDDSQDDDTYVPRSQRGVVAR